MLDFIFYFKFLNRARISSISYGLLLREGIVIVEYSRISQLSEQYGTVCLFPCRRKEGGH